MIRLAVLGAGAWGTAIACVLAGRLPVTLWVRDPAQAQAMEATRSNERYLAGVPLPESLALTSQLERALEGAALALIATPVAGLRSVLEAIGARLAFVLSLIHI